MEKRKWDVNSISLIQFSCGIKRKARIWEIWKLQLQDKWYLKGSYLIWLNLSSNAITEMHYLQVFSELLSVHPELCPYQICALRRGRWGLRFKERGSRGQPRRRTPGARPACGSRPRSRRCRRAKGSVPRLPCVWRSCEDSTSGSRTKKGSAVKFCSLALSGLCFIPTVPWQ